MIVNLPLVLGVLNCENTRGVIQESFAKLITPILTIGELLIGYSSRKLTFGSNNFLEQNDIGMMQGFQNLDFPNGRNGKAVFFLFGIDTFEGDNFFGHLVLGDKDGSVRAFAHLVFSIKDVFVSQHNRCRNGNRFGCRANAFCG